ncbi:MAG: hypothetical protein WD231_05670 [Candidatus Woykebacteria bacterium]
MDRRDTGSRKGKFSSKPFATLSPDDAISAASRGDQYGAVDDDTC